MTQENSLEPGIARGYYDFALLAGSWDARSTMVTHSEVLIGDALVLTLPVGMYSDRQQAYQASVLEFAKRHSANSTEFDATRAQPFSTLRRVAAELVASAKRAARPLRLLVDLAGTSRYASLGILGWSLRTGLAAEVDFTYGASTGYAPIEERDQEDYVFRSGQWLPTAIPGLGRSPQPGARQRLIVSAGFEGRRTRRLVDLLEPDEIVVVSSDSPSEANNAVLKEQCKLLEGALPPTRFSELRVPLDEVDVAAYQIQSLSSNADSPIDGSRANSILLTGPKSTSLACAIAALRSDITNVFYVQSERHEEVDVLGVSTYFRFTVALPWSSSVLPSLTVEP